MSTIEGRDVVARYRFLIGDGVQNVAKMTYAVTAGAKDQTTAIGKVKGALHELSGAVLKVAEVTDSVMARIHHGLNRMYTGMLATGTAGMVAAGGLAKIGMAAVESENLFGVALGKMEGKTRAWSVATSRALRLNEYEVRQNVGTFYVMFDSMKLGAQAAYGMSTGLTKLAYDMSSFYNIRPGDAFEKLRSGIVGEVEPLRQLGVLVDEETVKTYAFAHGIAQQGAELTAQQKVLARYGVIMAATSKAQGDLARTAESPTNIIRAMTALFAQASAVIYRGYESPLTRVLKLGRSFTDWLTRLSDTQKAVLGQLLFWGSILLIVGGSIGKLILAIAPLLIAWKLLTVILGLYRALTTQSTASTSTLSRVLAWLSSTLGINTTNWQANTAAMLANLRARARQAGTAVAGAATSLPVIGPVIAGGAATVAPVFARIGTFFSGLWGRIATGATGAFGRIAAAGARLLPGIVGALANPVGIIVIIVAAAVAGVVYLAAKFQGVRDFLMGMWEQVSAAVRPMFAAWGDAFTGIWAAIAPLAQVIGGVLGGALLLVLKYMAWGISMAANTLAPALRLVGNVGQFIGNVFKAVFGIFVGLFTGKWDMAFAGWKGMFSSLLGVIINIGQVVMNLLNSFLAWIPGLGPAITKAKNQLDQWGKEQTSKPKPKAAAAGGKPATSALNLDDIVAVAAEMQKLGDDELVLKKKLFNLSESDKDYKTLTDRLQQVQDRLTKLREIAPQGLGAPGEDAGKLAEQTAAAELDARLAAEEAGVNKIRRAKDLAFEREWGHRRLLAGIIGGAYATQLQQQEALAKAEMEAARARNDATDKYHQELAKLDLADEKGKTLKETNPDAYNAKSAQLKTEMDDALDAAASALEQKKLSVELEIRKSSWEQFKEKMQNAFELTILGPRFKEMYKASFDGMRGQMASLAALANPMPMASVGAMPMLATGGGPNLPLSALPAPGYTASKGEVTIKLQIENNPKALGIIKALAQEGTVEIIGQALGGG